MAENGKRVPNEALRYHRRLRGWTLDDVAEGLHRLAAKLRQREVGVDAHMVGRWERGVRRPAPRYVSLLSQLFGMTADALHLVEDGDLVEPKEGDLTRRQFVQHLALVGGAFILDCDPASILQEESRSATDCLLADIHALTRCYARQVEILPPRTLLPALRRHVSTLIGLLESTPAGGTRCQLLSLTAESAAIAGRLHHLLENRAEAHVYWTYARMAADEAGDASSAAFALALQRAQHSSVPYRGRRGDTARALALLDAAESRLGPHAPQHLRAYVLASRAEDHAANGDELAARQDLDAAQDALAKATDAHDGFFARWDAARIAGYRGSCAFTLDRFEEASEILEEALRETSASLTGQRSAVLTDLAAAYARLQEVEHACALLSESIEIAQRAGLAELVQRALGARQHLSPWRGEAPVRELDERILPLA